MRQTAGQMKDQVWDTLGNGTHSSIVNSVIGVASGSGNALLGAVDYGIDGAMPLTACSLGDSYCDKALREKCMK